MKHRRNTLALVLSLVLVLGLLTACGGGQTTPPATAGTLPALDTAENPLASDTAAPGEEETKIIVPDSTKDQLVGIDPEDYLDLTGVDFSNPTVVIQYDDFEGMQTLAKQMQNFEIPVGTVVEVYGEIGAGVFNHTVVVPNEAHDTRVGTTFVVPGLEDSEYPPDQTTIHIIGVVRTNNDYFNVLVVPAEHYEVLAN